MYTWECGYEWNSRIRIVDDVVDKLVEFDNSWSISVEFVKECVKISPLHGDFKLDEHRVEFIKG